MVNEVCTFGRVMVEGVLKEVTSAVIDSGRARTLEQSLSSNSRSPTTPAPSRPSPPPPPQLRVDRAMLKEMTDRTGVYSSEVEAPIQVHPLL
jgi:hypothetical protein